MMNLFIHSFLMGDYPTLKFKMAIVGILWVFILVAVICDLRSGMRKARQRGEMRTSYGIRQTVSKFVLYYTFMIFAFMFDCIGTFFYPLPFVSMLACVFLLFIEGKSILEKAGDKHKRSIRNNISDLTILLNNKDDLLKGIADLLDQHKNKEETTHETNIEKNS